MDLDLELEFLLPHKYALVHHRKSLSTVDQSQPLQRQVAPLLLVEQVDQVNQVEVHPETQHHLCHPQADHHANSQYLYSVNSRNGINTTTSTAATPTNVNQELCPPNQCDGSAIDIAKSGLDK